MTRKQQVRLAASLSLNTKGKRFFLTMFHIKESIDEATVPVMFRINLCILKLRTGCRTRKLNQNKFDLYIYDTDVLLCPDGQYVACSPRRVQITTSGLKPYVQPHEKNLGNAACLRTSNDFHFLFLRRPIESAAEYENRSSCEELSVS